MRPPLLATCALLCAAALAGCGSSGKASSTGGSATTAAPSSTKTSTTPAHAAGSPSVKELIAKCKGIISSESKLPARSKAKLEGACSDAAKGDTQAVKTAAREVCEEVIASYGGANGAAKEAALKSCRK